MPQKLTVILSEKKSPKRAEDSLCEALAAQLADRSEIHLCLTPSLYDLPAEGAIALRLAKIQRPLIVLGWLHPRAMFWTLAAHGVAGQMGQEEAGSGKQAAARMIWCIDLRGQSSSAVMRRIDAIAADVAPSVRAGRTTAPMRWTDEDQESRRWYPVVDHERCRNCLECLNFCLFGVYGLDENEQLFVEQPDACRDGCPACARVCPAKAIIFPMVDDVAIAGGNAEEAEGAPQTTRNTPRQAEAERNKALGDKQAGKEKRKAARPVKHRSDAASKKLDGLVDDLEGLDL